MGKKSDCHEALDKFVKYYGAPNSMIYDGAQEQVVLGTKFQANFINTASMVIHQRGNIPTKTQQGSILGNCTSNCIKKCLEHTVRDNYGSTDTHTFPRLWYWRQAILVDFRDKLHLTYWQEKHQTFQSTYILHGMIDFGLRKTQASERPRSDDSLEHCKKLDH